MSNCQDELTSVDLASANPANIVLSSAQTTSSVSLYPFILHAQSTGLNLEDPTFLPRVLRPLDSKDVVKTNDELSDDDISAGSSSGNWVGGCIESQEDDDEIIIHVRFSALVRIKSILIGTGGGQHPSSPRQIKMWANRPTLVSFSDVDSVREDQSFELLEATDGSRGAVEYPVRVARFANVTCVDLYFGDTRGGSQSRLFYLGFMGESRELKKEPGEPMTVGAENAVQKQIDGVREEKRGAHTVK
ncbi:DUF1000-domain-containing protein [Meredithblackwellia eburnea MCA 4105]